MGKGRSPKLSTPSADTPSWVSLPKDRLVPPPDARHEPSLIDRLTLRSGKRAAPRKSKKAHTRRPDTSGTSSKIRTLLRGTLIIVLLIIAIPLLLAPAYNVVNPISTTMMVHRLQGRTVDHQWLAIDDISDRLKVAVVTAEDARFCDHIGIDFAELANVVEDFKVGARPRGASTIPMQLAKNLFLWNSRSYLRKVIEVPLALYIDLVVSKRRMLEIYLNIAELGPGGRFGAQAGAQHFFQQPATALTWRKASLLATMLPSPYRRNALRPSSHHSQVASVVERRARQASPTVSCLYSTPKTIK